MIRVFRGEHRFLSNFYPCKVEHGGMVFATVEHAYQAAKTTDDGYRRMVAAAVTPGDAKKIGGKLKCRPDWETYKFEVMEDLLRQKFSKTIFKDLLLFTGLRTIVEGNMYHDNIWGDCYCDGCLHEHGQNHLGKMLMKIRSNLRKMEKKS